MPPLKIKGLSNSGGAWGGINPLLIFVPFIGKASSSWTRSSRLPEAQKESKSESELDEMWWKMAGELVAKYYAAREEVEKDVEGGRHVYAEAVNFRLPEQSVKNEGSQFFCCWFLISYTSWCVVCRFPSQHVVWTFLDPQVWRSSSDLRRICPARPRTVGERMDGTRLQVECKMVTK